MADTIDQARKMTQGMLDETRKTGKAASITADSIKLLMSAIDQLSKSSDYYKTQADRARESTDDLKDSFSRLQVHLQRVALAFEKPKTTLRNFADTGIESGDQLMKMFSAVAGLMFGKKLAQDVENATKAFESLQGELTNTQKEIAELEQIQDPIKYYEQEISKQQELCKSKTACNEDELKNLQEKLKAEKQSGKTNMGLTDDQKKRLDQLKEQEEQQKKGVESAQKSLDLAKALTTQYQTLIAIFGDAFDRFVELDKAAGEFRKKTGLGKSQMGDVEKAAREVNQELAGFGVTIDDAYDAAAALKNEFGSIQNVSKDQIETVALLNKNLGVTNENAAGFLQKMESVGGLTPQQAKGMANLAASTAKAAGIPLNKVMEDVANASDETLAMMKGNVRQMTLASIQAQRLGTNLGSTAKSARGLLNFSESVHDEMEASVLLGKNLNLNYARRLAFKGDAAGAQAEILKQVSSMGDFQKMYVWQQEALAKASGYSVAELGKMLKNQEKLNKLSDAQKKRYEDATKALKEQNEESAEDMLAKAEMATTMDQLSNTFKAFKQSAAQALTPLVTVAAKTLVPVMKILLVGFNIILTPVKLFGNLINDLFNSFKIGGKTASEWLDVLSNKFDTWVKWWQQASQWTEVFSGKADRLTIVAKGVGAAVGALMISLYLFPKVFGIIRNSISVVTGSLTNMFKLPGLKTAESLTTGVVDKVKGAASGFGNTIKSVGSGIANVFKSLGAGIKNFITYIAEGIKNVANSILDIIGKLGSTIGTFISAISKGIGSGIAAILTGLSEGIGALAVGLSTLGAAAPVAAPGLAIFAGVMATVTLSAMGLAYAFKMIMKAIEPYIPLISVVLLAAFVALKEVMIAVSNVLERVFVKALSVVSEIFSALGKVVIGVANILGNVFGNVLKTVGQLFDSFKGAIVGVADVIGEVVITAFTVLRDIFLSLPNLISQVAESLGEISLTGPGLLGAAAGITALGASLAAFGALSFLRIPFTKSPLSKLADLGSSLQNIAAAATALPTVGESLSSMVESMKDLNTLNAGLNDTALILQKIAIGASLAAFGALLFLRIPLSKLADLGSSLQNIAAAATALPTVGESLSSMVESMKDLNALNVGLYGTAVILQKISEINFSNLKELGMIQTVSSLFGLGVNGENKEGKTKETVTNVVDTNQTIVDKLDELISLMASGGIAVNLDGRKVSERLALASS